MPNKKLILLPLLTLLLSGCDFLSSSNPSITDSSDDSQTTSVISDEQSSLTETSTTPTSEVSEVSSEDPTYKEGLNLVFNDDFTGNSLSTANWTPMIGDGTDYGIYGWGNSEKQWYTKTEDNLEVKDGNLIIRARKESMRGMDYTSARIRSAAKVSTKYGYIEARIKLPAIEGLWPAFWMLPEYGSPYGGWPNSGEIDIMEAKGRLPNQTSSALHYGGTAAKDGGNSVYKSMTYNMKEGRIDEYHTYAVSWEEELIEWFVDDNLFFSMFPGPRGGWYSGSSDNLLAPFDQEFHILLNMAVGGHFDEHRLPPSDFVEAEMLVDYVRIYHFA